ncbi:phage tail protein [Alicyclobacillus macrosporangiidus]|uniref:Phage minor structural protein, N-terminal region n=1 Tax=Alicyclobacillus macrosporangiidus TaxID=392015 RepID=A0A1I7FWR6_9BACL|nr:phage tail protein [Alicyclobacillus macrosporangiidus]SFU40591.1 phage minor structural protein, N-terminal region [Alicyclobacillus macrosporangiidus]
MQDYPKVYDRSGKLLAVLDKAFSVQIQDQLITDTNGQETLTFSLPANDPKLALFSNEDHVRVGGSEFVIRVMESGWDSGQGIPTVDVTCEAVWYDLAEYDPITQLSYKDVGPALVMQAILSGTDWSVGTVEITTPGDFSITESTNRLAAIRQIPGVYGGELKFDSISRKVHLLRQVGSDTGFLFAYGKNMKSNKRTIDTRNLVTRLYVYGANGLSIAPVNNGLPYIEDYSWYDSTGKPRQVKSATLKNEEIANPSYLLQWGRQQLSVLSKPTISYTVAGVLTPEDPVPGLGDLVNVYDQNLGLNLKARVAKRTIDVLQPENTTLELETALPTLADQLSNIQAGGGAVADVTDAVNQAMQDVVMFNNLFNSRADDGLAYWISNGWDVDNTKGVSGTSSFHATGSPNATKTLSQTIYPASRSEYTLSAQVELDNVVKLAGGQVGFNVTIKYKDGTRETQFFALA